MYIRIKKFLILCSIPILIILIFIFSGFKAIFEKDAVYKNRYNINVYYNPDERSIFASQKLSYKNTEDIELKEVYFHLYPNAFLNKETVPMIGDITDNYPEGFSPGQIDIKGVWVDNNSIDWSIEGKDKTLLYVKLNNALKTGGKISIKIDFQEKVPYGKTDFGSYNGIACFENWYPVLCVYDNEGWHKEPSCKMGEVNFSEVSDYVINIDIPSYENVASTGNTINEKQIGDSRKSLTLKADNVRDFTWISSKKLKSVKKKYNGIMIKSYFLDKDKVKGTTVLDYATRAIDFYCETFGKYPYDSLSIVETSLYGGAMEYPMLTSIGEMCYTYPDDKILESAVVHEIAHQWWYVIVGNNEYKDPWLDEAMATYSEAMYFEKYYGTDMLKSKINPKVGMLRFDRQPGDSMDKFKNSSEYNLVVYVKGSYILHQLRERIGDNKYVETLKEYYRLYKFKNACTNDFLKVVSRVCGSEAEEFIELRLYGIQ